MKHLFLLLFVVFFSASDLLLGQHEPRIHAIRTQNEDAKIMRDLIDKNYEFFRSGQKKILVKSQDPCGFETSAFNLRKDGLREIQGGSRLCLKIDKHGDHYAEVAEIKEQYLRLKYNHTSEQRSLGKNIRHTDVGYIEIELKSLNP